MPPGFKAGGRKAGTPNRSKEYLMQRLKEMYGNDFDPLMRMAENAHNMMEQTKCYMDANPKDHKEIFGLHERTVGAFDKIAAYTQPKLKAVEVKMDNADPFNGVSREDLILRLQILEKLAVGSPAGDGGTEGGAG